MGKEEKKAMKRAALRQEAAPASPETRPASPTADEKLSMLETMLQQELTVIFEELKKGAAEAEKNCDCEGEEKLEQMKAKVAQMKEKLEAAAPEPMKEEKKAMKRAALRQEA